MSELDRAALERLAADSSLAQKLRQRAGAVIVTVRQDRTEILTLGHGIDSATPMEIGSVTKGFTGLLLAESMRRGEVSLDARIDELLFAERWPGESAITLLELATHTSGLPRLSFSRLRGLRPDPYRRLTREHLLAFLRKLHPRHPRAAQFSYSNLGYAVLGLALEKAAGESYAQLLAERMLTPFGLGETRLQLSNGATLVRGGINPFGFRAAPWHADAYAPCGALVSTADDMVKFVRAIFSAQDVLALDIAAATEPRVAIPGGSIGLGWIQPAHGGWVWHNGGTFGYSAYVGFNREHAVGAVVLANQYVSTPLTLLGHQLMRSLLPAA